MVRPVDADHDPRGEVPVNGLFAGRVILRLELLVHRCLLDSLRA
jgi:hypothetical protein